MMGDGTHTEFENIGAKNCKHKAVNCKYKDDKFCFGHVEFEMPVQCSKCKCPLFSPVTENVEWRSRNVSFHCMQEILIPAIGDADNNLR